MVFILVILFILLVVLLQRFFKKHTIDNCVSSNKNHLKNLCIESKDKSVVQLFNTLKEKVINYDIITLDELSDKYAIEINIDKKSVPLFQSLVSLMANRNKTILSEIEPEGIRLRKGEKLYYTEASLSLSTIQKVSTTVVGGGLRSNMNGIRSTIGNYRTYDDKEMKLVDTNMDIFVTNQRVILKKGQKSYSVDISNIIDVIIDNNSLIIVRDNKEPYKITGEANFVFFNFEHMNMGAFVCDQVYNIVKAINFVQKKD